MNRSEEKSNQRTLQDQTDEFSTLNSLNKPMDNEDELVFTADEDSNIHIDEDEDETEMKVDSLEDTNQHMLHGFPHSDQSTGPLHAEDTEVAIKWDFREATLPPGVEVVGAEPEFVLQKDGSTALLLPPMSYLKEGQMPTGLGGKLINDYTLTVDMLLDRLPSESMSLFQCSGVAGSTEGEAFVYATGGVGIFGEVGVPEAGLQPGKFNRVVVTVGPTEKPAITDRSRQRPFRSSQFNSMLPEYEDEDEFTFSRQPSVSREMRTYVNTKKCATISSDKRGVLAQTDGRFAAHTDGITVFGSNRIESMGSGKLVKFIEFRRGALKESVVRSHGFNNRTYSLWDKQRKAEIEARQRQLTLKPVYKNPPPFWMHPMLCAEFGDAFLEGTGLEGGDLATSTSAYELVLNRLVNELAGIQDDQDRDRNSDSKETSSRVEALLTDFNFSHEELQSLNYLSVAFQTTRLLCRRFELTKKNGIQQLVHYFKVLKKTLSGLQDGQILIAPGGIGSNAVIYIVEREGADCFRFCVVNTNPTSGLEWHVCTPEYAPYIKYQTVLVVKGVTHAKIMDEAFWGILLKLAVVPSKQNTPDKLYNLLLPFLVDKPTEQIVCESEVDEHIEVRMPQRSNTSYVRCITEASYYVLRRRGLPVARCRQMLFAIELQMIEFIRHDLVFMRSVGNNDKKIIRMACTELARTGAQMGNDNELSLIQMQHLNSFVSAVNDSSESLPCDDADASADQSPVDLQESSEQRQDSHLLFPLMDRLRRLDDVDGLAGPPIVLPKYVPVDMLQIPEQARDLDAAISAIRYCDRLCTLISVQPHCIKNRSLLKVSLIQHTFTSVLPCPRARSATDFSSCIWQAPMTYSIQLDIAICLGRIMEHFISSVFALYNTKSLDAIKIVVTGCIAAVLDVTLRKVATDQPSEFCLHYMGSRWGGRGKGYGLSMAAFDTQSETIELHTPELSVSRACVLDYFAEQKSLTKILNWQDGHHLDEHTTEFLVALCADLAFPSDMKAVAGYITTSNQLINKNYPEFHILRDISLFVKYVQNVDPRAFPQQHEYSQMSVEPKWDFQQGMFVVEGFQRGFMIKCYPDPPFTSSSSRYPSAALASNLASPHEIKTEDDVLHIKNLPSFHGCLGQQDSELLLSFLTVPYLRIPLVLTFFSTEDRIHSLRSEELQAVLDAVLFEPGRFLHADVIGEPEEVPCRATEHMATSHGLLMNEIHRSPDVFLDSIIKLLSLSMDLDVGTFHSMTVPIILYILRLSSRVESFVSFLIDHGRKGRTTVDCALRSIELDSSTIEVLQNGINRMRYLMRSRLHPMLESWCTELSADCEALNTDDDAVIDANSRSACQLHAHLLLLYRNLNVEDYNFNFASTISSSFLFLTTRHTWNMNLLGIPEHEIFEMLATQRRNLILWSRSQSQQTLNELMEATIRVTVGTGGRSKGADPMLTDSNRVWAFIRGDRSVGRFSVASTRRLGTTGVVDNTPIQTMPDDVELGIEIDFQTVQLTLKSSHLKALDTNIANDLDVQTVFGKKSMQGSITESTENRLCVNLIGRGHSIHFWRTPDERSCVQDFDRLYSAGEVEESEQWIVPIFEPVRLTYMTQPFELQVCMPEEPLSADADVACLVGIHPKNGGTWKEIFVFKALQMVQVYNVASHGRRFYRVLEYTTNCKYTLREMQPSLDDRRSLWPPWERHGAGHPYADHWANPLSCVIHRGWDYEQNLSGGEEVYLPSRLLYGLLPMSLLDSHMFWQDENDNIRGYPHDKSSPYLILVELVDVDRVACTGVRGTCARVKRVLKAPLEQRMRKQMDLLTLLDKAHMVNEKDWKVDASLLERLGGVVDYGCHQEDIDGFVEALKTSGVIYEHLDELITEIEAFAMEQGVGLMDVVQGDESTMCSKKGPNQLETAELTLVSACYAASSTKFATITRAVTRLENCGHILFWTMAALNTTAFSVSPAGESIEVNLIEMPRLKLNFHEKMDENGVNRLYSLDHSHLFVSNFRSDLTNRLMTGLPHSLMMSSSNHELHILVPAVDPVRPRIASSPFTTELVMNRNMAEEWNASLDTFYYLYPIHVSLSFLFSPTLSSALYMLLVRFLNRNYEEVFRLASTIGTDTELSPEEKLIFHTLGRSNSDSHPDAHACRLKISYVTMDAPINCPWDLTRQCSRYITKLTHISLVCRLTLEEEYMLLQRCICDSSDPRFYDMEGKPLYTLYEVTLVKNRKHYLEAMFGGHGQAAVFTVPREKGTRWTVDRNMTAFMCDPDSYASMEVQYAAPAQLSGHALLEVVHRFWSGQEDSTGLYSKMGFLFIYELLTGTKTAKLLNQDVSRSLAIFLLEMLADKDQETLLPSILSLMCRVPYLAGMMPKYSDNRTFKNITVKAYADDRDPISPLGSLLLQCLQVLQMQISNVMVDHEQWTGHPNEAPTTCVVLTEKQLTWTVPSLTDFSCSRRVLSEIKTLNQALILSQSELNDFAGYPLAPVGVSHYTSFVSREESGLPMIDTELPFDVSKHSQAKTAVAVSMISRLKKDVKEYADSQNSGVVPKCAFLTDAYQALGMIAPSKSVLTSMDTSNGSQLLSRQSLADLIKDIEALRKQDEEYVQNALAWLTENANAVHPTYSECENEELEKRKLCFLLRRFCRLEASIWLEFLFGSVLSSTQFADLSRLNPFVTDDTVDSITDVIVATVLHANRISHANRCILDARELDKTLADIERIKMSGALKSTHSDDIESSQKIFELRAALSLKDESLSRNLNMERHYVDKKAVVGGEEKRQRVEMTYDPRFLLFEFTWSILLRKSQVEIVNEYMSNISQGVSTVKQMIMGAGKTTIVCPLLTLMLGDGKNLVVQVVPPALLELSRTVMRSTFSSIMHKRVFTLNFDRSSEADPTIYKKLCSSISSRGVVITTPTTIKSMMLKFMEWMYVLNDRNSPRSALMEADCQELGRVLKLFRDAILIMDEVDLILHPMKSELNFPIGDRLELDYSPQRWQMPIHLMDAVFYAEHDRISVGFKQSSRALGILERLKATVAKGYQSRALQRNPHIVLLNTEWYHNILKPLMAEWLYMWIETQHIASISEAQTIQYLLEGATTSYNSHLAKIVECNVSHEHKKMLNLGRDWLLSYLPHVLQKIDRVSYGLLNKGDYERAIKLDPHMPRTRAKLAIPFVGKDVPSKSSEFAHPDVIIGLTILAYRYEGLRWTDFEDIISNLRSTMTKEIGPFKLRKSSLRYSGWVKDAGGCVKGEYTTSGDMGLSAEGDRVSIKGEYNVENEVVPLRLLKRSNEEQMKKLYSLLQNHPDTIHFYLENFIFPAHMDSKVLKLSAAGQELGGEMLFKKRIGFSGTPSDLLPVELGRCGYEKGSDGQMIHVMTSPLVCSFEIVPLSWSPKSILHRICTASDDMRFHALIDTGALITGMTNLEVATFLLHNGMPWCEGVVFLDDYDRKMVLVRSTGRVLKMAQCGIPAEQRFAFYDQVHTTGMDIQHTLNARAVLTLSKDMVFRDYAQGAYRMRGINKGQKIHVMVIPEVCDLISRELAKIGVQSKILEAVHRLSPRSDEHVLSTCFGVEDVRQVLRDINAWLVINSMRSERVQFNQLCIQNVSNVWRKKAYAVLLENHKRFSVDEIPDPASEEAKSLDVFCEAINFNLNAMVPSPTPFADSITRRVEEHASFIPEGAQHEVVKGVLDLIALSGGGNEFDEEEDKARLLGAEMVQEQEQEREQQQEQEQEQEIEIEKYVDLAYSRDHEEQIPWLFSSLASPVFAREDGGKLISTGHPEQFYPASSFKLIKREPLMFPHNMLVSSNYFNLRWSGARRIKNIIMTLEWVPKVESLHPRVVSLEPLSDSQEIALMTALSLFDTEGKGSLTLSELTQVLKASGHYSGMSSGYLEALLKEYGYTYDESGASSLHISLEVMRDLLTKGRLSRVQEGRRVVAVSLAEAETIRRILHLKNGHNFSSISAGLSSSGCNSWNIDGSNVAVALRCISAGNIVTDKSTNFISAEETGDFDGETYPYTTLSAYESFRFLNCDMFFSEKSLNILLRALHSTSKRQRKHFFKNILMCRRRMTKKWNTSPIAKVFTLSDQFGMLKQRALSASLASAIKRSGLLLYDAFCKFDYSHNGFLTPGEVWGGFDYLGIDMTAADVLDFVNAADSDRDGLLSFREFVDVLQDPDKVQDIDGTFSVGGVVSPSGIGSNLKSEDNEMMDDIAMGSPAMQRQVSLTPVVPKGEEELRQMQAVQRAQEEEEDMEAESEEEAREKRIKMELEAEEDEKDRQQEGGRNPMVSDDLIRFNFGTGRLPRRLKTKGDVSYTNDEMIGSYLKVHPASSLMLSIPFHGNCGGRRLNQYSITMELQWTRPSGQQDAIVTAADLARYDRDDEFPEVETKTTEESYYWPIFSLSPSPEMSHRTSMKAHLWADQKGRLHTMDGMCSVVTSSGGSTSALQSGKWHLLTIVVDCVCGEMEVYLDGSCVHSRAGGGELSEAERLKPPGIDCIDGLYSSGGEVFLFGDSARVISANSPDIAAASSSGAGLRYFSLHPRCLHQSEVAELTATLKRESQAGVVNMISEHLQAMGVDAQISHWAATQSEGDYY